MSGDLKEVIKTCEYWRKKFQVGCTSNVKAGMNMVCSVTERKANLVNQNEQQRVIRLER